MTLDDGTYSRAHLRPLPRCRDCDRPATQALYTGRNAHVGDFCDRHAKPALKRFQERG